ncbi:MAG: nonstructural protein [Microvirus sp.]|nr:MAG: nonstructural protein [Microvirus sp.]
MVNGMYSVFDTKTSVYSPPFVARNQYDAIRMVRQLLDEKQANPAKYPMEFALFHIGDWDDEHGVVACPPAPRSLGLLSEFVSI